MLILDRYIMKGFVSTLVFSLFALCVIFLVVSLLENLDEFLDRNAGIDVIAEYYLNFFPEILKILTPIATLLSTLFTIGRLSTRSEITAMKSGGMSLYRLMIPVGIFTVALSFGQLYFNGWVVPRSNVEKLSIERVYLNRGEGGGPIYNLFLRVSPKKNLIIDYYNAKRQAGTGAAIEVFEPVEKPRLKSRIESGRIVWDSARASWKLIGGVKRRYSEKGVVAERFDTLWADLSVTRKQIERLQKSTEEMTFDELREYIYMLKRGGKDVRRQMIEYYGEYAFPFANIIVVLFGVPFASVRRKGGIAIQIGAAMVISFTYLVFTKIGQTIGYASDIDPILAGWSANIIFFIFGLIVMLRTKT